MAPLRDSRSRVGPSRRDSTMPKRPSTVTSSSTSAAGAPAAKTARVFRASCRQSRCEVPALNSFTTCPGAQAWTSEKDTFADLLSQGSPHRPSSAVSSNLKRWAKTNFLIHCQHLLRARR
jgi:hypothetical protein